MTPLEIATTTAPQIGAAGAVSYFHPDTLAKGQEIGLDGFRFYFLGRGGVLGDVEPAVVAAAFGYFTHDIVASMWDSGKETVAPRVVARAYADCAENLGRTALADVAGLDDFNDAAQAVISGADVTCLALFAGMAAEDMPDDAPAKALRNVMTLRELRGSVHLVAIVASGLSASVAHAIRRPDDVAMFGWDPAPTINDGDQARLDEADVRTDEMMASMIGVLNDAQQQAYVDGAAAIAAALAG